MSTDLVVHQSGGAVAHAPAQALAALRREQVDLIKETIARGATDTELAMFIEQAQSRGLNPFNGQIWAVKRRAQVDGQWREVLTPMIGVAGLRLVAQRTGRFGGIVSTEWCGPDEVWKRVWLSGAPPAACRVVIRRTDWPDPIESVVLYSEFVQKTRDGKPTQMWAEKPTYMLAKVAEAAALRRAFPEELAGLELTYDDGPQLDQHQARAMQAAQHQLTTGEPPAPTASTADLRYRDLVQIAAGYGLDVDGMFQVLTDAQLPRPNARTLADTPEGARNHEAMAACLHARFADPEPPTPTTEDEDDVVDEQEAAEGNAGGEPRWRGDPDDPQADNPIPGQQTIGGA